MKHLRVGFFVATLVAFSPVSLAGMPISTPLQQANVGAARPIPGVDPTIARYDNACARFAGAMVSNSEDSQKQEVAEWKATCNGHPTREICSETAEMVSSARGNSMGLNCGSSSGNAASLGRFTPDI